MKTFLYILILALLMPLATLAQETKKGAALINGKSIRYKSVGIDIRKPGEPVIVFESGLGGGGATFEPVFPHLPKDAAYFIYNRNGLGGSEIDTSIISDSDVVGRLHELLTHLNIQPPYLLVGHSLGGPLVRLFASKYPSEVAGLVLIDPMDFMLTPEQDESARKQSGSKTGYGDYWLQLLAELAAYPDVPEGFRHEMNREKLSHAQYFREYQNLKPLSDIPVAILIAYNRPIDQFEEDLNKKLGINARSWSDVYDRHRIQNYSEMISNHKNSFIELLPQYLHGIHTQDPELTGQTITRIFRNVAKK